MHGVMRRSSAKFWKPMLTSFVGATDAGIMQQFPPHASRPNLAQPSLSPRSAARCDAPAAARKMSRRDPIGPRLARLHNTAETGERRFIEAMYYDRLNRRRKLTPESHHRFQILSNIPSSKNVISPAQPKESCACFESKKQRCYSPKIAELRLPARTVVDDAPDSRHK
jgi:hypothetical protein